MDKAQIESLIPIRDPYLWIDEVVEVSDSQIHARKFLAPELDLFRGHYIGAPVFPGAMQCECAFQAAAVLIARVQSTTDGSVPVIARMNNVKFKRMVQPGDTLDIFVESENIYRRVIHLRARMRVDGKLVSQLEFVATETGKSVH